MRRLLGPLLLAGVLLLAGCGDSTSDAASDSADQTPKAGQSSTPSEPTMSPSEGLEAQTIALVSQTAVGGEVDLTAVPLDDEEARQEFVAQFRRGSMDRAMAQAVASATIPEGYTVMGAVVSIGCDVPPGVTVTQGPDGWVINPQEVASPLQECFAPVTTVALVAVPA